MSRLVCILLLCSASAYAQIDPASLEKWRGLKYSMFIHFGLYSQLGGVWEGKEIPKGLSEQIQAHAGIYSDTYADVAKAFNPTKWNPDSIVLLAKAAGMGSVVITSKHHDGFAMFHTAQSDFNIVDATPYKRDVLKELSEACVRHGIRFGVYFSLIDWHFPQASPISSHNSDNITPEHHEFNKKQVTELLTNYGQVSELWFDMGSMSIDQSKEMRVLVHSIQPNCMIGSRIGNDMGDFTVLGDNQEPDYIIGVPWQSPASFFDETWGYRSWQKRTDADVKMDEKLTSLIKVISRGGNYLLNIGPRGDGSVVGYEKDILLRIGKWLDTNREAVYNTKPDPFHIDFPWGNITTRGNKLYLHLLKIPADRTITLPNVTGNAINAFILENKLKCPVRKRSSNIEVTLPSSVSPYQVVAIEFEGSYSVPPPGIIDFASADLALKNNNSFRYFSNSGIDYNTRYTSTIKCLWNIRSKTNQAVLAELIYTEEEKGKTIDVVIDGVLQSIRLDNDEPTKLRNDLSSLKPGAVTLRGPYWSGIEEIASNEQLPLYSDSENDKIYTLPAGLNTAYNAMQEIESPTGQSVIVRIISGDGIVVTLNGEQLLVQNNPLKKEKVEHFIRLDLKKGQNQLLIKLFNHFQKSIYFRIDYDVPQVQFVKKLTPIKLNSKEPVDISWQINQPTTPHEDMDTPNLILRLSNNR